MGTAMMRTNHIVGVALDWFLAVNPDKTPGRLKNIVATVCGTYGINDPVLITAIQDEAMEAAPLRSPDIAEFWGITQRRRS
jgi:hypothetical protein